MLFKEKGYDEFVAKKIAQSREDSCEGRVLSLEESRVKTKLLIERKAKILEQSERETAYG
ncbi:hypothetical protein SAMN05660772_02551 [Pasteurella testudinis DSM 23072]|uniref:Uncharacterized protein n=1 Tax=Pasteurella testudinis DSM 23072 TaxID=1122938 RepID=A0A1W1UXX4_9PAST|nr:hypothetical protein [Pasteurella testudinis]SMB85830.1 hypothetical protein SAMN05660772_02551 [Pasteurella testudinis DSM 23072]SUB51689.1 Uncharacterised protein [Pasteurella testudinis]